MAAPTPQPYLPGQPAYHPPGPPPGPYGGPAAPQFPPYYPPGYVQPVQMVAPAMPPPSNSSVVIVSQPTSTRTVVHRKDRSHLILHLIIAIFFPPWIIVFLFFCIAEG